MIRPPIDPYVPTFQDSGTDIAHVLCSVWGNPSLGLKNLAVNTDMGLFTYLSNV